MNTEEANRLQAACWERYTLQNQAIRQHEDNVKAEEARFGRELKHIDTVFALRLGHDLPWTEPPSREG